MKSSLINRTVVARQSLEHPGSFPSTLLSVVCKTYNPVDAISKDEIVARDPTKPSWSPNGVFINGIRTNSSSASIQQLLGLTLKHDNQRLFWLEDDSCFVVWDRKNEANLATVMATISLNSSMSSVSPYLLLDSKNITGVTEDKQEDEVKLIEEMSDFNEAVHQTVENDEIRIDPEVEEEKRIFSSLYEFGMLTIDESTEIKQVCMVSVSALGGLQSSSGEFVGHARRRKVSQLRSSAEDWVMVNWKSYLINL